MAARKIVIGQKITAEKLERARQLRRGMTPAESMLWQELRKNKLGRHFRRQQIIAGFIVDFFCLAAGLVIEVDGAVHRSAEEAAADSKRDQVLAEMGLRTLRFKNEDVLTDLPRVVEKIRNLVRRLSS